MSSFQLPLVVKIAVASVAVAGFVAYHHFPCCGSKCHSSATLESEAKADWKLVAHCVEARTASVFAGACHYNGELMTQGDEALLGISVESGSSNGVDLAGVRAAVLVASDKNLKLDGPRRSIVYVSQGASEAQRDSVVALLKERSHNGLGEILAVEFAPISIAATGDAFTVDIPGRVHLDGAAMPDRACCKMPNLVWYDPLVPLKQRLVGSTREFRVQEPRLAMDFKRVDENSAFLGTLSFFDGSCAAEPSVAQ